LVTDKCGWLLSARGSGLERDYEEVPAGC